jgi:Holliday junction DNA helicase RuvA
MIGAVRGRVVARAPGWVELETAAGLVMHLLIPVSGHAQLRDGAEVLLHTVLKIRDEDPLLYGFPTPREKTMFEKLIAVSGVGGKIALSCVSAFSPDELVAAIGGADVTRLSSIPGIGRKTAQRIILELTGKLEAVAEGGGEEAGLRDDLVSGLVNLGYAAKAAREAVQRAQRDHPGETSFAVLFKSALKRLHP